MGNRKKSDDDGGVHDQAAAQTTHFGFTFVPVAEKIDKVRAVFDSVASRYDLMNDVMSLWLHHVWKWVTIEIARIQPGQRVLDVAAGSGDLSAHVAKRLKLSEGDPGELWVTDINATMLARGRDRLLDEGFLDNLRFAQVDAECLPFPNNYFDRILIGFGLRNVTDQAAALRAMAQALRPGGRALVLEFSKPSSALLQKIYDAYSFNVIPWFGKLITGDQDSYQYLVESIRMHPDQDALKALMLDSGFSAVDYHNMCGGIVSIHCGFKY